MRLGLRMGLNSRQGGGGDLPSLDLAFALDKTLTARKGPTPDFTRVQATSTGSTYIGADKLIKYAAANEPRFDHDPVTGLCKGILIEEPRTNLVERSEAFNDAYWSKSGLLTPVPDSGTAPSGAMTADLLTEDTGSAQHRVFRDLAVVSGGTYTASVFVKRGAGNRHFSIIISSPTVIARVYFNLDTETVATTVAGYGTIKAFPNGWYLCTVTGTVASTSALVYLQATNGTTSGTETYTGDGTSGLFLWGAQVEAGAFPLSYIPTTSGTAARSADVCSIIGDDFSSFYNQSEGTMFAEVAYINTSKAAWITTAYSGSLLSPSNYVSLLKNSSGIHRQTIVTNNLPQGNLDISGAVAGTQYKYAGAYKTNDAAFTVGGVAPLSDASVTLPVTTALSIGNTFAEYLNGHIARIQYFRKRLSNSKLQTLTTP